MKKYASILITLLFFTGINLSAKTTNKLADSYLNNYGESFIFNEGGITFSVFQNGEFDFYIEPQNNVRFQYNSRNINISFNSGYNYDAYVQYDDYGAVIQIENIPVYYDYYGRVSRIGNVEINYNFGRLARIGGLHIYYNHGVFSHYRGFINRYNRQYVFHPHHHFFARPVFEYRIVSYQPYRHHYKPMRTKYHKNHSNAYYANKSRENTNRRIATHRIPERIKDRDFNTRGEYGQRRSVNTRSNTEGNRRYNTVNQSDNNNNNNNNNNTVTDRRTLTDRSENKVNRSNNTRDFKERKSQHSRNNAINKQAANQPKRSATVKNRKSDRIKKSETNNTTKREKRSSDRNTRRN